MRLQFHSCRRSSPIEAVKHTRCRADASYKVGPNWRERLRARGRGIVMSETNVAAEKNKSLAKGLIAGLIAGLAATAAKTLAERIFPPQPKPEPESPVPPAECVSAEAPLSVAEEKQNEALRWGLGAVTGAAYGAVAEFYPEATARHGASFGLALDAVVHQGELPVQHARVVGCWPFLKLACMTPSPRLPRQPRDPDRAPARQPDRLLRGLRPHRRTCPQAGAPVALAVTPNHSEISATLRSYRPGDWQAMHALDLLCFAPVFQFSRGAMRSFAETPGAVTVLAETQVIWQASASRTWKIAPAMWSRWMWLQRGAAAALRSVSWPWSRPNSTPPEPKKWSCTSSPATQKQSVSTSRSATPRRAQK